MGTRRAILEAASQEFATHGFEEARVRRIASAAGVGHQLITYYFGGKQGLYEALTEHWMAAAMPLVHEDTPFAEVVRQYVHLAWEDPSWSRMLMHEDLGSRPPAEDERAAELLKAVAKLRERQANGEVRGDIDVGFLGLVFFAATIAPKALPWIARELTQQDPTSQEFINDYAENMARIMSALGEPSTTTDAEGRDTAP
ncbi:TetR/AcrR family transcriptional regulator [Streptomyces sp. NPDC004629]|uniref:TetR/AcrR family transcriptional regulator n=1 Tax=Streptomyces sp. NPDC004629 TaxID=3364705 RepID=UPI0036A3E2FF